MIKILIADIVSSYVANNFVENDGIPDLIEAVYQALGASVTPQVEQKPLVPAVPIRKSVFPECIVCLEDGKRLKLLRKHLNSSFNMTPDEYRAKWGLPRDYPMVAPNYAIKRSNLAKSIGLGRKRGGEFAEVPGVAKAPDVPDFAREPSVGPPVTRVKEGRRGNPKRRQTAK